MAKDKLDKYKAKRDFELTQEPSGKEVDQTFEPAAIRHPEARRDAAALRSAA